MSKSKNGMDTLLSHLFREPCPEPESSRGNAGHETGMDMNVGCRSPGRVGGLDPGWHLACDFP